MAKTASTRRKSSTNRKSSRSPKRKTSRQSRAGGFLSGFQLGPFLREHRRELAGVALAGLAALSTFSLLAAPQTWLGQKWLFLIGYLFGWIKYLVPFILLLGAVLLLIPDSRKRLPAVPPDQAVGLVLFTLLLFVAANLLQGLTEIETGLLAAQQGTGGGVIGTYMLAGLILALGKAGATVLLLGWVLAAVLLTFRISLVDAAGWIAAGGRWVGQRIPRPEGTKDLPPVQTNRLGVPSEPEPSVQAAVDGQSTEQAAVRSEQPVTPAAPVLPKRDWKLPVVGEILEPGAESRFDENHSHARARLIEETLESFGAPAQIVEINHGPTITQFGVEPSFVEGRGGRRIKVKVSKIVSLADDLALALAAPSVRVQAPVPGKGFVGIEVPNPEISLVALQAVITSQAAKKIRSPLRVGLGQDVAGNPIATDLGDMPHLLIAGTTGSGKSVCVNTIIASLLLQNTPDDLRFVMIDPKRVELTFYNGIPHLLSPVLVNLERVVPTLQWVQREMDQRYQDFSKEGMRNLEDYNKRMKQTNRTGKPYLVVVIDELADLMMMAPDETERVITRLAQLSRATGIHLVIATQRPSTDVVTGIIKANFPARIAFAVASSIDSRVILDQPGAERLLGKGDMLFNPPDAPAPIRMQGAFVSDRELERLIRFWKNQALGGETPQPIRVAPEQTIPAGAELQQAPLWEGMASQEDPDSNQDDMYEIAVQEVRSARRASISMLQRKLRIGYTRSARLIDQMEEDGIIGPAKGGSHAREVLDYGEPIIDNDAFEDMD
ncbi:MAG: DNA translocase FtsK 4TM domain-containing protein [Anaerolineales bacterium]|nr:DNA translocase FtsK 4TM domain-containing protein [Anaerolineales bacterium]